MTLSIFTKTASEKAMLKVAIKKFNADKKKINPNYIKRGYSIGLKTKKLWELDQLLQAAKKVEILALS